MTLYIGRIIYPVISLGPGKRLGIFFSGCSLRCPGCMSQYLWEIREEQGWDKEVIMSNISRMKIRSKRVVISGGEPFEQPEGLKWLLLFLRESGFNDIWVYTGNYLEKIKHQYDEIINMIDVLIDGPFKKNLPTKLVYRGSANQRLILLSPMAKEKYQKFIHYKPKKRPLQVFPFERELFVIGVPSAGEWNEA